MIEMVFNVPMECEECENAVTEALNNITGLENVKADWKSQVVNVFGCAAPSEIVRRLQNIGKDAIIRGTGAPNSAAVSILQSFSRRDREHTVKGLARIVAVEESRLMVDLTLSDISNGEYFPQIRSSGNLSEGPFSTGRIFHLFDPIELKLVQPNTDGTNLHQSFLRAPLKILDLIGRSFVLTKDKPDLSEDSICGVVARSAGAWENNKTLCTCSGQTVWQERLDALEKGITS